MKKKKILLGLFTASAIFTLAACGNNDKPSANPSNPKENPTVEPSKDKLEIKESKGYTEGAYVIVPLGKKYEFYYESNTIASTKVDSELVTETSEGIRCDIIGIPSGEYTITAKSGSESVNTKVTVTKDDRSGYAHFKNTTGVGAYKNDGTLKDKAVVVYVNNENKNTVKATLGGVEYTGLSNIVKASTSKTEPLDIRITDEIQAQQFSKIDHGKSDRIASMNTLFANINWNETSSKYSSSSSYYRIGEDDVLKYGINTLATEGVKIDENGKETTVTGITHLDGLTNTVLKEKSGTEYDSYFNELDVKGGANITIEGVGENAGIFQWGFCFNQCNSIEVKNLTFSSYTEDAIGIQGADSNKTDFEDYWIHNCTFNPGVNNWDLTAEHDKMDGDGSTDFKYAHDLTISYCQYNRTHKTALIGSSDSSYQYNITMHHNYYNTCGSRLPYTRQSNLHMYNNYYYASTGTNMQINSNAYAFIEGCYFENTKKTFTTKNGSIKLWNNEIQSTNGTTAANTVYATKRTEYVPNSCTPDKKTDYSTFDVDPKLFYFDTTNNVSDVELMLKANAVPEFVKKTSGAGKLMSIDYSLHNKETNEAPVIVTAEDVKITKVVPTTAGVYGAVSDGSTTYYDYSDSAKVTLKDGKIKLIDYADSSTTYAYVIFDTAYSTGKHTYKVNITLEGVGSKWGMVQFIDGNKNIAVRSGGIETSAKNLYCYSVDGKTETVINSNKWATKSTYDIILTVDYDNNTAKISINGSEATIANYTVSSITGIQFMTAKSATDRSFTVNSYSVE